MLPIGESCPSALIWFRHGWKGHLKDVDLKRIIDLLCLNRSVWPIVCSHSLDALYKGRNIILYSMNKHDEQYGHDSDLILMTISET